MKDNVVSMAQKPQPQMKPLCADCQAELNVMPPPFPPQICANPTVSTVVMVNGRAQCPKCGAQFSLQVVEAQVKIGFKKVEEQSRIIKPTMVPPGL
jgi:hypothetical protein